MHQESCLKQGNLPDNQGLAAAAVTSGKDAVNVGAVLAHRSLDVLAHIQLNVLTKHTILGSEEAYRQKDNVRGEELAGVLNVLHRPAPVGILGPLHTHRVDALDLAAAVVDKL